MRPTSLLILVLPVLGCDLFKPPAKCPPCECKCDCEPAEAQPKVDISELAASASRRMHHGDGEGCLADLDALAEIDPKLDERLSITRGQCEMLVGRCQDGKRRVAHWYEIETAMTPERAEATAEQLASMRCREGDATDRDRLLVALFDLSDGAYVNRRDADFCRTRVEIARELLPRVTPGPDDAQIEGGGKALFFTAASCFARAGDCASAWSVYAELFPGERPDAIEDPEEWHRVIRKSFDDGITLCEDALPPLEPRQVRPDENEEMNTSAAGK